MLTIPLPDSSNPNVIVTLGGITYVFKYAFNSLDKLYRLTLSTNGVVFIHGLELIEGVPLLQKYNFAEFDHGELFVGKMEATSELPGRDNLGLGKPFELTYIAHTEMRG